MSTKTMATWIRHRLCIMVLFPHTINNRRGGNILYPRGEFTACGLFSACMVWEPTRWFIKRLLVFRRGGWQKLTVTLRVRRKRLVNGLFRGTKYDTWGVPGPSQEVPFFRCRRPQRHCRNSGQSRRFMQIAALSLTPQGVSAIYQ